jgi:16S rRNA A1518/A1519 N6-dimethyltransferase RsmA/KsgA/DIM1 with predicted DNA glycosylase/AP lyase activity
VKKICDINPNNFIPIPKVWSTCLRFSVKTDHNKELNKKILTLIKQGFAQKRKKLCTNLMNAGYNNIVILKAFSLTGISEYTRAEQLSLEDWKILAKNIL